MTWLNRTLCDVLQDMRKAHETHNYSYLLGLIEEAQSMGYRMEAKLNDIKDLEKLSESVRDMAKERDKLKAQIKTMKKELGLDGN